MKGKTTIQLFDAKTKKEMQRIEDTNFITNAYKKYIEDVLNNFHLPCMGGVNLGSWCSTSPKDCMRGLLLFDSVFPENADTFFPTTQVEIGHAGGDYSGADIYRGDYNANESGDIDNGYRQVWDFATDKANGTIASVCLTTLKGGNNGYKNQGANNSDYGYLGIASGGNPSRLSYSFLPTGSGTQARLLAGMTQDKTKMFIQTARSGTISLYTYSISKSNIAFAEHPIPVSPIAEKAYAQKADITIPSSHYLWFFVWGNTIYGFYLDRSVTPNLSYLKTYDSSLNELSSVQLDGKRPQDSEARYTGIIGDYFYVKVYNENNLYKYNRTTGEYIEKVTGPGAFSCVCNFDNDRLVLFTPDSSEAAGIYYLYNGTQFFGPFRTYFYSDKRYLNAMQRYPGTNMYLLFGNYSYYTNPYIELGMGYFGPTLFTINNLATPVVKDNTKTMKVTYDITW